MFEKEKNRFGLFDVDMQSIMKRKQPERADKEAQNN